MIDGRFDQHFLEVFAEAREQARNGDQGAWLPLVLAGAATTVIALALMLLS